MISNVICLDQLKLNLARLISISHLLTILILIYHRCNLQLQMNFVAIELLLNNTICFAKLAVYYNSLNSKL